MDALDANLKASSQMTGRVRKAPEHFLDADGIRRVKEEARTGRRGFIRHAFAAAAAAAGGRAAYQDVARQVRSDVQHAYYRLVLARAEAACTVTRSAEWALLSGLAALLKSERGSSSE